MFACCLQNFCATIFFTRNSQLLRFPKLNMKIEHVFSCLIFSSMGLISTIHISIEFASWH